MISVVIPLYNERESVRELHERIVAVLKKIKKPFEIIFVDDGSQDGTFAEMEKLNPLRGFRLRRNQGQTLALAAGIHEAKGEIIITMDGDLENQPEDIPKMLTKLEEGYDVVAGWRGQRWAGQFFSRKFPSLIANSLISRATGVRLHDHGCVLRVYRRSAFDGIEWREGMHRVLAAFLGMNGARVTELPVSFAPRAHGESKYGLSRTFKVLLDVVAFYFFKEYASRPMHFFGYAGFVSLCAGILASLWAVWLRVAEGIHFTRTPLPLVVALFGVVGVQFILMGLVAELIVRVRPRTSENGLYDIAERIEN